MDWKELGLKMGLEIHQQLNSESKLFCPCPTELTDMDYEELLKRNLKPTQSELGKIDRAAFQEAKRKLQFEYQTYHNHTCLVECDEEPPHKLNEEALDISLIIASLLNMAVVDEFHTMRKQVIDGSNTGGFQRTGLVATDGYLDTDEGRVVIESLGLEEDAARRITTDNDATTFRLDRLGIPLAEITTDPSMHNPEQVKQVAYQLGQILRSTRVKRGIGTIRQDLNISIKGGARIELKGVQDLDLIPTMVEREVQRQIKLIEIKDELNKRDASVDDTIYDLNPVFKDTSSKILGSAESVKGIILKNFNGLVGIELQEGRRLGTEFSSYAKKMGVAGIFHTDELPAYGISQEEVDSMRDYLKIDNDDAIIIVAHDEDIAISALEEVLHRAKLCFTGVVEETRKALTDGNSEYMRPLPTSNRMYLETDIPSFIIPKSKLEEIKNNLPELPDVKKERIIKEYKLSEDLGTQLLKRDYVEEFEAIMKDVKVDSTVVASLLAYNIREIKRDNHDISKITHEILVDTIKLLEEGKVSKDALSDILISTVDNNLSPMESAEKLNLLMMNENDVANIIREIVSKNETMVKERQMGAMGPIMGMSMKQLKGRADGKIVNKIVREEIQKLL